jgi:hypothetical protein
MIFCQYDSRKWCLTASQKSKTPDLFTVRYAEDGNNVPLLQKGWIPGPPSKHTGTRLPSGRRMETWGNRTESPICWAQHKQKLKIRGLVRVVIPSNAWLSTNKKIGHRSQMVNYKTCISEGHQQDADLTCISIGLFSCLRPLTSC